MGLDLLYQQDRGSWMLRLEEVRPPLNKTVDALAWVMIANAIASNDYYLYICAEESALCSENVFSHAGEQAKNYADMYNFSER